MKTAVYCCKCSYKDFVGAISDALAYQAYLEMGAAALVIALYLGVYKKGESHGLQMRSEYCKLMFRQVQVHVVPCMHQSHPWRTCSC